MNTIQMVDLTTPYKQIQNEMDDAILSVVRSGQYINGKAVQELAEALCIYTGAKYVIPCANGTDALQISLMALNLQPGDEVIVPAFTYAASAEAIALLKLTPVLVDVDPLTFNIDLSKLAGAVSSRTKAIMVVHLFGQCCEMEAILKFADEKGLFLIEDNAQSIGAVYTFSDGTQKQAGTMGDIGTLSFFPTKNLGCYGDGGALLTNNDDLAQKLKMIASHGQSKKYTHEIIGCNSRLDTIQAAILCTKLPHLDSYIEKRKKAANIYAEGLRENDWIQLPECIAQSTHVYHQFTIQVKNGMRDKLREDLQKRAIPSMIYYPIPLHKQAAFQSIARIGSDLSVSENLCNSVLSLPMHTELDEEQIHYITQQVNLYE